MDAVQAAEQAHMAFDRWVLARAPSVEGVDTAEDFYAATGIPSPRANRVCRTRWGEALTPEQVAVRVGDMVRWFAARNVPFMWEIWPSVSPTSLPQTLDAAGLERHDDGPMMTRDLAALPDTAAPAGLSFHQIDEGFAQWVDTMTAAFSSDAEEQALLGALTRALGNKPPMHHFLAMLDGEAVATASTFLDGPLALVMNVGTLPPRRGRGIGSAVTLAALRDARASGSTTAVLQATEMGEPVYRQLGFTACCRALSYTWAPPEILVTS